MKRNNRIWQVKKKKSYIFIFLPHSEHYSNNRSSVDATLRLVVLLDPPVRSAHHRNLLPIAVAVDSHPTVVELVAANTAVAAVLDGIL